MVDWLQIGQTSGHGDTQILVRALDSQFYRHTTLVLSGNTKSISIPVVQNEIIWKDEYLTFLVVSSGTITWVTDSENNRKKIYYRINVGAWTEVTSSESTPPEIYVYQGDVIRFKGTNSWYERTNHFGGTAKFELYGNILSMIYGDDFADKYSLPSLDFSLAYLFNGCTGAVSAENLILQATSLTKYCYCGLFKGCTNLTSAPELPANTLSEYCYTEMFANCTSITTAPVLGATTLASACYAQMFINCTSLTSAPELPASALSSSCYSGMFNGCTSLTTAPVLSSTTLAASCYSGMFGRCTSLTTAPELPATTLAENCYESMFSGCISLVIAPVLSANTMVGYCYGYMFSGCTALTYLKCYATNPVYNNPLVSYTFEWLLNVGSNGTFECVSERWKNTTYVDATTSEGIPMDWSIHIINTPAV